MQSQDNTNVCYGGFFVRLAAYFVDVCLIGIVLLVVKVPYWIFSFQNPGNMVQKPLIFQFSAIDIFLYLLSAIYFILMTYLSGATIGKKMFQLRVIPADQKELTLINIIYRETIGRYLSTVILWIGYFLIGVDKEKRGLHDILCDTRVIYDFEKKYKVVEASKEVNKEDTDEQTKESVIPEMETTFEDTMEIAEQIGEETENAAMNITQEKKYQAATYNWRRE